MRFALALCVLASIGYGVGAVLQAAGARRAGAQGRDGIAAIAKQPAFLLGLLTDVASWTISRVALRTVPLFVVQTILAGSVGITVVLARLVLGTRLRRSDQWAIVATTFGLAVVAASAGKADATGITPSLEIRVMLAIPVVVFLGVLALKLGKSRVLAVLSGASFTGSALAARLTPVRNQSFTGILTEPLLWAVMVYALVGLGLHAAALINSAVGPVTAAMWSTEVLLATFIGAIALGDYIRRGWVIPATLGMSLTLVATIVLARSPAQELEPPA